MNDDWKKQAEWNYPTRILYGSGRINEVANLCQDYGWQRPLLVVDPGLLKLGLAKALYSSLDRASISYSTFSQIEGNPTIENLQKAVEQIHSNKHDSIVAMGGGSALDIGKLAGFMCVQQLPVWDFEDIGDLWKKANHKGILPAITIPTTSGTGAEVGRSAVVSDKTQGKKKVIFHPDMMPKVVILDYSLTQGLPVEITKATGMDAFAHCLEAYCAVGYHPMADGLAIKALSMIKTFLPIACNQPQDLQARSKMMVAACMGAVSFQKGLGAVHSISHALGALYNTHHGLTNALLLAPVLRYNHSAIEQKISYLANILGCNSHDFSGFMNWFDQWYSNLALPRTLKDLGIKEKINLDLVVQKSIEDPTAASNPRRLTEDGINKILQAIL